MEYQYGAPSTNGSTPNTEIAQTESWEPAEYNVRFVDSEYQVGWIKWPETVIYDGSYETEIEVFFESRVTEELSATERSILLVDLYASIPLERINVIEDGWNGESDFH